MARMVFFIICAFFLRLFFTKRVERTAYLLYD